jgi:hypothetical protein
MNTDTCGVCGHPLGPFNGVTSDGASRCFDCYNRETAERLGIDFDETPIEPVVVPDADGAPHSFVIRSLLVPTGREMIAVETPYPEQGGYEFKILGDFEADAWNLFEQLYERMRREMAVRHVELCDHGWQLAPGDRLVARIDSEPGSYGNQPRLVIDGKVFTWDEVGHMLMSFEGFTLRAQVESSIEVVGGPLLDDDTDGR